MRRSLFVLIAVVALCFPSCRSSRPARITVGSKFFTEQVILAELLAQHIESRTGIPVEYTGTALTAVLNETPSGDSSSVYNRVKQLYSDRFHFEVTEPLGFENTFAMVIRSGDAKNLHLRTISDIAPIAPKWRAGVGYEFLERPDGFRALTGLYGLHFAGQPHVMDLGLIYRALLDHQVDIVAGNSTDGLIDALGLVALADDRHYFPPYDAVPVVRQSTLARFPQLRAALADLAGKLSASDMRHLNYSVDALHQDPVSVVRQFRSSKGL